MYLQVPPKWWPIYMVLLGANSPDNAHEAYTHTRWSVPWILIHVPNKHMFNLYKFPRGLKSPRWWTCQFSRGVLKSPRPPGIYCRRSIYDDPFIRAYLEDLLKNIRTQVLLQMIQPYTRIRLPYLSAQLNIPEADVEQLLVSLILDNRVAGRIDQVLHYTELNGL